MGVGIWRACVDSGYNREIILVFVKVFVGNGEGAVERVLEGRVEWAEGEFVDYVGEIEGWSKHVNRTSIFQKYPGTHHCDPNAGRTPDIHGLSL